MKFAVALISALAAPLSRGSVRALLRLSALFVAAVLVFSAGFHTVMAFEGREFSWWASIYWTIVTMSTLGFGDIVFESDLGRMYTVLVLLSGAILILILLPFTFIQLVYLPWRAAMRKARTPRAVPASMSGHMLVMGRGPIEEALMRRAKATGVPYALIVEDAEEAVALQEIGYQVLVGQLDDPNTYRAARADQAALALTARSDQANTNVAFTLREITDAGVVVATATSADSVDVLQLAGCDQVLQLGELLGGAFARRILAPRARSSVISTFEDLVIAEASAAGTALVGKTLGDLGLRQRLGVSVVAAWDRGSLQMPDSALRVEEPTILILVGTREQLAAYNELVADDDDHDGDGARQPGLVVILGGGRVGRATARALREAGPPCRVVERLEERVRHLDDAIIGDAADHEVLRRAGIDEATAVVVTTHDDDTNIYLTLYCRRLRPSAEVLGRVNLDRNVSTMYRAGADFVLSYASTGATEVWNALRENSTLLLAEGLLVFRMPVPVRLAGRSLREAAIPAHTGCSVIAVFRDGAWLTDLDVDEPLPSDGELALIGDEASEGRFLSRYVLSSRSLRLRR
ncbi:MAG TPA: NAD-binding protein [Egibacteraceae bacterium]|nr:NAD-binding protein [Egibacteraceae bacterium]